MLDNKQKKLLAQMRADNAASQPPFKTQGHWENINRMFDTWFSSDGIADVINQRYNWHFAGTLEPSTAYAMKPWIEWMSGKKYNGPKNAEGYIAAAELLLLQKVAEIDELGILDKLDHLPWGVLTAIHSLYSIHEHIPILTEPMTVVDLGAGWGRIGYVLRSVNENTRYIVYDLPESLLISITYLPKMLGEEEAKYNYLADTPGAYFMGAHMLPEFPDTADVFINIASFMEMSSEYVSLYLDIIEEKARALYSLQRNSVGMRWRWESMFLRPTVWSPRYNEGLFVL